MSRIDILGIKTVTLDKEDFYFLESNRYVIIKSNNLNEKIMIRKG